LVALPWEDVENALLQDPVHLLADLFDGLLDLCEGAGVFGEPPLQQLPIVGEGLLNQLLAFCRGHGVLLMREGVRYQEIHRPPRKSMRLLPNF
jgi:hypothetical protein